MIPTNTGSINPCSNISSNCVVWQGPDIPCINLCNGDTISDVIAKLAEELCLIINSTATEPNLTGLDLFCVLPDGQTEPSTLEEILQLIIDYVCNITQTAAADPINITLAECLKYNDNLGNLVTVLPIEEFSILLGNKICNILSTITLIQTTLDDHEARLIVLENCVLPCSANNVNEAQVLSSCLIPGGTLINASTLLLEIERVHCNLESAVGSPSLITTAINAQCILGSDNMLNGNSTYSSIPGWVTNTNTLAESNKNLWLVVCDMYQAIQDIKLNCCPGACDSIVYNYTASVVKDNLEIPTNVALNFNTAITSSGYTDCGGSTNAIVTDVNGLTSSSVFNFNAVAGTATSVNVPLTNLNVFDNLNVSIAFCLTDGVNECKETINKTINLTVPCPSNIAATNIEPDGVTVTFNNNLGNTASYIIKLINVATNAVTATRNVTAPGTNISEIFTGLIDLTDYAIRVTTQINGKESVCSDVLFTTTNFQCLEWQSAPYDTSITYSYIDCNGIQQNRTETCSSPICSTTICGRSIISSTETFSLTGGPCPAN